MVGMFDTRQEDEGPKAPTVAQIATPKRSIPVTVATFETRKAKSDDRNADR